MIFLMKSLPFKTEDNLLREVYDPDSGTTLRCISLESLKAHYVPAVLCNLDTGEVVCPDTPKEFIRIICKNVITGVRQISFRDGIIIDPETEFLIQANKSGGLVPFVQHDDVMKVWSPGMPDQIYELSIIILDKLRTSDFPMLQPDLQSAKASLMYDAILVSYEGSLLYIQSTKATPDCIPLYKICNSISKACQFGRIFNDKVLIRLELNDQLLSSLLEYVLALRTTTSWTTFKFALNRCSSDMIVTFVTSLYEKVLQPPGVLSVVGRTLVLYHLDEIYDSYAKIAELFEGRAFTLGKYGIELYRSLSNISRQKYFSLASKLMLTDIESVPELLSEIDVQLFYNQPEIKTFDFSLASYLQSTEYTEQVTRLVINLSIYVSSSAGKEYIAKLQTLLYIVTLEYTYFENVPEILGDYTVAHMEIVACLLQDKYHRLLNDPHRRYTIDI